MDSPIPLSQIILDQACQMRPALDHELIADYAAAMRDGAAFPPVKLVRNQDNPDSYWLVDGWHTVCAAIKTGQAAHHADIVAVGTRQDAILHATGANATHGRRRCDATKRNAVQVLLRDPDWSKWSLRRIAEQANVSVGLVSQVKGEMEATGTINRPTEVLFQRNGRVSMMHTANLSPRRPPDPVTITQEEAAQMLADPTTGQTGPNNAAETRRDHPEQPRPIPARLTAVEGDRPDETEQWLTEPNAPAARENDAPGRDKAPPAVLPPQYYNAIIHGECDDVLARLPDACINLIVTSPPYGKQRQDTYGGVSPDKYLEWFSPISHQLLRVLRPDGTFILNIKEHAVNGERHTYVIELILALREQGWLWTEEFIWHKKNSFPGRWSNRFRDGWERVLQFNRSRQFAMYQEAVMEPAAPSTQERVARLKQADMVRHQPRSGTHFSQKRANWVGRDMVFPDNVLYLPTESYYHGNSAVYPVAIPAWFARLFTQPGDIVLDPFIGSGTTAVAAIELERAFLGIEAHSGEYANALRRVAEAQAKKQRG